jgi:flagellar FliL protein
MGEEAEQEGEGQGGGMLRLLILVVPALLIGAGAGWFFGSSMTESKMKQEATLNPPEGGAEGSSPSQPKEVPVGPMFKLDPFVVNLNEPRGNRYLKTTIQLEMENESLQSELERRQAQMRDIILALLTSKTTDELKALEGKFRLREELLSRLNALLVNGSIRRVYFTEFVIQ